MTMLPTIRQFMQALQTPDLSFATLTDAQAVTGADGLPQLRRTTRFAEAEIDWRGGRWLVSLPLHPSAMRRVEQTVSALRKIDSPALTDYRMLAGELRIENNDKTFSHIDLVLQSVPSGGGFSEALANCCGNRLLAAIDALEAELRRVGFVHRNLKPANLVWSDGRLYPLRYHDAVTGTDAVSDAAAFEALRELVRSRTGCMQVHDAEVAYRPSPRITGHRWASHPFEGLICVEDETGFGYVDPENRPVIASRFRWAGDFREGRAEVETETGMGVIDRTGAYVVPPCFEIVDYDPVTSRIRARRDGQWSEFDYTGRQIAAFGTEYE